jgi:methionyl-tRNA synthetase
MNDWIYISEGFALSLPMIIIIALWSLFWKGLALWHSARRGEAAWFVVLLVINTIGILEIVYLFVVLKLRWKDLLTMGPVGQDDA